MPVLGFLQALIGNSQWSSRTSAGPKLYHVGTIPNAKVGCIPAYLACLPHSQGITQYPEGCVQGEVGPLIASTTACAS